MRKIIITLIASVFLAGIQPVIHGQAADTTLGWHKSGVFSLNMSQSSFTNWAAGGQNSVALNGLINLAGNYKTGMSAWDNALTIGYGKMLQKGNDLGWVKTDDRIDFLVGKPVKHLRHRRPIATRFGVFEKCSEPLTIHPLREIDKVRPLSRNDHRRSAMAVRTAEFGIKNRPACRRRCRGMKSFVADDKRSGRHKI